MADSTGHKVPKTVEKHKVSNMINRTTSESLRVGDSDKILNHPTSLSASTNTPRKKTSFQITSVTVGAHMSNDGGDDSADDLDESHTDDISDVIDNSRVTDIENETPSLSEDTFSKDDVYFNSSTSLGSAPVIPTSSQYGLAIVSTPEGCGGILNNSLNCGNSLAGNELHVSVTDNVINLGLVSSKHLDGEMRDLHSHPGRNERFKVVKIESTEPFKRGRWMCMDYLDHTMVQQQQQTQNNISNAPRLLENVNEVPTVNQCTGTDSGISMSEHPNFISAQEDQVPVMDQGISIGNLTSHAPVNMTSVQTSVSPGQTMQFSTQQVQSGINSTQPQVMQQAQSLTAVPQSQQNLINANHHQSLQSQQMQQVIGSSNMINQQQTPVQNQQQQHQPMSQPLQQIPQGAVHMQHMIPIQQNQTSSNIQQQFQQQPAPMHQQIQQPLQQNIQQQPVLHQQQQMPQHLTQPMQHPHTMTMPIQQQTVNQVPVSQPVIQGQQPMLPQIPQSQQLHQMQQQGQTQHIQHPSLQPQHTVPGVSCPQLQQQSSQPSQQQVYHPASQPIIQPVMGTQPNIIPQQQQPQYFTNTQPLQGGQVVGAQVVSSQAMPPPSTLQSQPQPSSSVNVSLQQTYPITSVSQPQQMQVVHPGASTNIQHVSSSQIPSSTIQMAPVTSLSVGNNLQIPVSQCTVLSPQASQGASLVQQQCYVSQPGAQPVSSSIAPTQIIGGSQALASSAVTVVPSTSVLDNTSTFSNETVPSDQMTQSTTLLESLVEAPVAASGEEVPPVEDAESASGTSAVAIDNKIEQAMDLVKSHLMFAVREEVEVLKEKIAELMDRINQLEVENTILKANASQETLAQLSTSVQPSMNNAP